MLIEPIRIVADWLKHQTYGVNPMLPLVKRDAGDVVPPDVQQILDETRDLEVAKRLEPKRHPALYVSQDLPYELLALLQTFQQPRDGESHIAIRYVAAGDRTPQLITQAGYTMRACLASITRLWATPEGATARQRNDVQLIGLNKAAILRVDEDVGQSRVSGGLLLEIRIRESATSV